MKKLWIGEIVVYILEIVVSIYFKKNTIFLPLFGYLYVMMAASMLREKKKSFLFCTLSGLIYDLFILSIPGMNMVMFPVIYFLIEKIENYIPKNRFTFFLLFLLEIFLYRTLSYMTLILIQYLEFSPLLYFESIGSSILLNFFFILCWKLWIYRTSFRKK